MIIKKEVSLFTKIEKLYLDNFSFNHLNEKITELKEVFSEETILDYFLTRANLSTTDNMILKYAYPIFLLSNDTLKRHADKIVESFSKETLNWFMEKMGKENLSFLLSSYLIKKINTTYDEQPFPTIFKNFLAYEFREAETGHIEVQRALAEKLAHFIRHTQCANDKRMHSTFYNLLENIFNSNKFINIEDEMWQQSIRYLLFNKDFSTHIIDLMLYKKLSAKTMDFIINYFNNLKSPTKRDAYILKKVYIKLFEHNLSAVKIDKYISHSQKKDTHLYCKLLTYFKDKKDMNYEKYARQYCEYYLKHIKNKGNRLRELLSEDYGCMSEFITIVTEMSFTDIQNEVVSMIVNNKDILMKSYPKTYLIKDNNDAFMQVITRKLLRLYITETNYNSQYTSLFDELLFNSQNETLVHEVAQLINLAPNSSEKTWKKIEQLLTKDFSNDNIDLIVLFMKKLDITSQEDKFNILLNIDNNKIKKECNDIMAKQLFGNLYKKQKQIL